MTSIGCFLHSGYLYPTLHGSQKWQGPTKSSKGRVRAFHFNLAQLFYNMWVLVNLEVQERYRLSERRPLTSDDVLHAIRDRAFEIEDLPK
jgi:hypothetical protein